MMQCKQKSMENLIPAACLKRSNHVLWLCCSVFDSIVRDRKKRLLIINKALN